MNYSRRCSCCGDRINIKQINFLIDTKQYDNEGNLCEACYEEQELSAWFEYKEIIDKVANAMKKPIAKFKFIHMTFEQKVNIVHKLMNKGIIKWTIG